MASTRRTPAGSRKDIFKVKVMTKAKVVVEHTNHKQDGALTPKLRLKADSLTETRNRMKNVKHSVLLMTNVMLLSNGMAHATVTMEMVTESLVTAHTSQTLAM